VGPVGTPQRRIRLRAHLTTAVGPGRADVLLGGWFPERSAAEPELFGVLESNAHVLCPGSPEFCRQEIGHWLRTALLCRVDREAA